MVLLRNHTPKDTFDSKYKPSFPICKKMSGKVFDVQDNLGKIKRVSIQHLQLLHHAVHLLTNLPNINCFGQAMKHINHLNLMPDLSMTIKAKIWHASQVHTSKGKHSITQHIYTLEIFQMDIQNMKAHG